VLSENLESFGAYCSRKDMDDGLEIFVHGLDCSMKQITGLKFCLSIALAQTAVGNIPTGMVHLTTAASILYRSRRYDTKSEINLLEELKFAVDDELIGMQSTRRCGCTEPVLAGEESQSAGEVCNGYRSFWGWLEEPEHIGK
jgi:hypothetical protein